MSRIAVITASNPGYENPGMITVDLAFDAFRKRLGRETDVSWFTLHPPDAAGLRSYVRPEELPFRYLPLGESLDRVFDHDAIVFWGDFLQTRHYLREDGADRLLRLGYARDRAEAGRILHRCLLLQGAPARILERTFLFGGTILHNSQSDYSDTEYAEPFLRLVRSCRGAWMREPLSASKITHLRQDHPTNHLGMDAAFLLGTSDLAGLATTEWSAAIPHDRSVGVFIGSRTRMPRDFVSFCRALATRFDAAIEWLPWLVDRRPRRRSLRLQIARARLAKRALPYTLGDLLTALRKYRFVITDTYHMCVNAWRAGTPAICVGEPQPDTRREYQSLNDLKKHVMYVMYDANDFYVTRASCSGSRRGKTVERLSAILEERACRPIADRIHDHARKVETDFRQALLAAL
jgi:hypothetical protein